MPGWTSCFLAGPARRPGHLDGGKTDLPRPVHPHHLLRIQEGHPSTGLSGTGYPTSLPETPPYRRHLPYCEHPPHWGIPLTPVPTPESFPNLCIWGFQWISYSTISHISVKNPYISKSTLFPNIGKTPLYENTYFWDICKKRQIWRFGVFLAFL